MKKLIVTLVAMAALLTAAPANAHLSAKPKDDTIKARSVSQLNNLKHARYVCKQGANHHKRWACSAVRWLSREYKETMTALAPKVRVNGPFPLPACTRELVNREGGWRAVVWNRHGSGAYGAPQALPGSKMASAGADWATNIWTQLRWMVGYVNGRYGGMCNALAFQIRNGYY